MIELPASTLFNRRIPKQKFYDNLSVTPQLKRVFTEQINLITWRNKIAPTTANIASGQTVKEIEVLSIKLNQQSLDTKALSLIDKEIPYHILFLLEFEDMVQAWIAYKEENEVKSGAFKPGVYYHTEWLPQASLVLRLYGLNMDSVYENFIRQIGGEKLGGNSDTDIKEAVNRYEQRQKLQQEIDALERKIQNEKQFNRQVELNSELKKLRVEIEGLK
jgi:hypothetical protein